MDYPGFGLSGGLHGYITSFDVLVDDVIEHFSKISGILPNSVYLSMTFYCYLLFKPLL